MASSRCAASRASSVCVAEDVHSEVSIRSLSHLEVTHLQVDYFDSENGPGPLVAKLSYYAHTPGA